MGNTINVMKSYPESRIRYLYRRSHPSALPWTPRQPLGCSLIVFSTVFYLLPLSLDG